MIPTTELKKGLKVEAEGKPYLIIQHQFTNPGKGSAFVRVKMKNLETGAVIERTYKSGVDTGVVLPDLEETEMDYMYEGQGEYFFMNQANYETISLTSDQVGDSVNYLQEGIRLKVLYYKGKPISVEPPNFVNLKVTQTDPGLKGDTAAGAMKKAIMETGLQINVPLFIKEGEILKVDTRDGTYVERVKE